MEVSIHADLSMQAKKDPPKFADLSLVINSLQSLLEGLKFGDLATSPIPPNPVSCCHVHRAWGRETGFSYFFL